MEEDKVAKWPDDLPPPIKWGKATKFHPMIPDNIKSQEDLQDLLHDMYWFPEDQFYMFSEGNEGIGDFLASSFEENGIECGPIERCFYKHPNQGYENDFIHLPPHWINHEWQEKTSLTLEYTRYTLNAINLTLATACMHSLEAVSFEPCERNVYPA